MFYMQEILTCFNLFQALMVLSLVAEYNTVNWLGDIISAQDIVHVANNIFLQDQVLLLPVIYININHKK